MTTSGKPKTNRQPVLATNVTRILAELQQLAANASGPLPNSRSSGSIPPTLVIRGK